MNSFRKFSKFMTIDSIHVILDFLSQKENYLSEDEEHVNENGKVKKKKNGKEMFQDLNEDVEMEDA